MTFPPSTPLPTVDTTASAVDSTVGTIVKDTEPLVESAIIAAEPVMATPLLLQIWEAILDFIFNTIANVLGKSAGYITIDIQTYSSLLSSAQALAALRAAQTSGDSSAITTANANADQAIANAVHYIGSIHS